MAEETTQSTSPPPAEEKERFDVSFGNGALRKLKELAAYLGVPENKLSEVLMKGVKIIDAVKDASEDKIVIESKDGKREVISIRDL